VSVTVAVTNADGLPVRGLTASDFTVVEDGQPAAITSVRAITETEASLEGRTIVLMLGGPGTELARTSTIQEIANAFLSRAGSADHVSVVRFGTRNDELTASPADMRMRVAEFRTISPPPLYSKTNEEVLDELAKLADELDSEDGRRQAVVWIGAASVFDIMEPSLKQHARLWPHWVKAIAATARANVSTYVVDPHGLTGRVRLSPDGLVAHTGGAIFDNTNGFEAAVDRVWNELGAHYVLGYEGSDAARDLHTLAVSVARPDVTVRARRSR
jgi:VWFA-related protein